jgi:hypothetical protein
MMTDVRRSLLSFGCSLILATPALCAGNSESGIASQAEVRKLHFPDKSIGALMLLAHNKGDGSWLTYTNSGKQIGSAQGTITLTIPPGFALVLDANRRVFENPILLKEISPYGIDVLKLSFISMDDREDNMLERAIGYVENLKSLRVLCFDRSEVNDAAILKLKNLPHLVCINLFLSSITGSCFKSFSKFPELYQVDAPFCQLDQSSIDGLAQIPKLKNLDLSRTNMTVVGAKSLAKLTNLARLNLGKNPKFDDACIAYLQPLSKLKSLDLRGTHVTIEGLKSISGIKLQKLCLPTSLRKNMLEITKMFPSTRISVDTLTPPTKDDQMMYAPLR